MKKCPNCGELLGDSVEVCFNCNYNFKLKRVVSWEETRKKKEEQQKAQEEVLRAKEKNRQNAEAKKKELYDLAHAEGQDFITTGYNFEGYDIIAYYGIVSGSVVIGTGVFSEFSASISDFFGVYSDNFSSIVADAERSALKRLIDDSDQKGGNAVIGVDFDYITFNNNMIGVMAKGTSVLIEKKKDRAKTED